MMSALDDLRLPTTTYSRIKEHELRFLIPSHLGGVIIGRDGKNVKQIRDETQTVIILPRVPISPERILSIQSSDIKTAMNAFIKILRLIMAQTDTEREKQAIRLLVNSKYVGRLIGKNGDTISKLRERLSAHVKIYHEPCPSSTDQIIQITGYMNDVREALRQIVNKVKSIEKEVILDDDILYDPNNFDRELSQEYGGYSSTFRPFSRADENITQILRDRPTFTTQTVTRRSLGIPVPRTLRVERPSNNNNSRMIRTGIVSRTRDRNIPSSLLRISSKTISRRPKTTSTIIPLVGSTQVSVPNQYLGRILGHGGEKIRKIRITSQARIDIRTTNDAEYTEETLIDITGSPKSISLARFLLEQAVLDANSL